MLLIFTTNTEKIILLQVSSDINKYNIYIIKLISICMYKVSFFGIDKE